MSHAWLARQLRQATNAIVTEKGPILAVSYSGFTDYVYCPTTDEYRVTADVAHKAKELGASVIAYASTWCNSTHEAKEYAKTLGVSIMPYGAYFAHLKKKGVRVSS